MISRPVVSALVAAGAIALAAWAFITSRIDLLLATADAAATASAASIDRDWRKKRDALTPSDHAPVLAELG